MRYQFSYEDFGARIKEVREALGLTQQELANRLGYKDRSTISKWEKGAIDKLPDIEKLIALCKLCECDMDYLLCEIPLPTKEKTDVQKATGLPKGVIDFLINARGLPVNDFISKFITVYVTDDVGGFLTKTNLCELIMGKVDRIAKYTPPDMSQPGNSLSSEHQDVVSGIYYDIQRKFMGFIEKLVEEIKEKEGAKNGNDY